MPEKRPLQPIPPGEILACEFLEPLGISQNQLARDIDVPPGRINEIIRGKRALTADTALRLERRLGVSARFWLNLQASYDLKLARRKEWPASIKAVQALPAEVAERAVVDYGDEGLLATDDRAFTHAVLRERIVEHVFIGDVLRALWQHRVTDVEVLRPEWDAHGYDVVMSRGQLMRHIQLKTQTGSNVSVNSALREKPSGCVILIGLSEELRLGPFYWFGGAPGMPLPPHFSSYPHPRRPTHNAAGERPVRKNHHLLPRKEFTRVGTLGELIVRLFGDLQ